MSNRVKLVYTEDEHGCILDTRVFVNGEDWTDRITHIEPVWDDQDTQGNAVTQTWDMILEGSE